MSDTPEATKPAIEPVKPTVETVVKIGAALTDQKETSPPSPRVAADIQIEDALARRNVVKAQQALEVEVAKTHTAPEKDEPKEPNT